MTAAGRAVRTEQAVVLVLVCVVCLLAGMAEPGERRLHVALNREKKASDSSACTTVAT